MEAFVEDEQVHVVDEIEVSFSREIGRLEDGYASGRSD
jgi:hypothetical protein